MQKKCGAQYVGETGQKVRKRQRNRLRQLSGLHLLNSDGHTEDEIRNRGSNINTYR